MLSDFKCPHCEIRLKANLGKFKCGICGSIFSAAELKGTSAETVPESLEYAREYLKIQKQIEDDKKGDVVLLHTDRLEHVSKWKMALSFFGIPIEEDADGLGVPPVIGCFALLCILFFYLGDEFTRQFVLDPKHLFRHGVLNFLSYSLVHADFFHLFGNLFFILPFADNVEDRLGSAKCLVFLCVAAISSALAHLFFDHSALPLLGASGVCFAVVTYYALKFPSRRLLLAPPIIGIFAMKYRLRVTAKTFVIFYVIKEALGIIAQLNGYSDVSHLGHIGGALAGLTFSYFDNDA